MGGREVGGNDGIAPLLRRLLEWPEVAGESRGFRVWKVGPRQEGQRSNLTSSSLHHFA